MRMHDDQVDVSADVVTELVATQFPQWVHLPVREVMSHGTVNALFRLGTDLVLRFPLCPTATTRAELMTEKDHIRRIAPRVTVEVPTPVAMGEPGAGYPGPWSVYRWIDGVTADAHDIGNSDVFAADLAAFVRSVSGIDTGGRRWDGTGRGGPLAEADAEVRLALKESRALVDVDAITRIWTSCRDVPSGPSPDGWIHADLMPGNLIVRDERLAAVIDFGAVGIGDPAVDLLPAWTVLTRRTREQFRLALGPDDAQWARGMGWALVQAIMALPYYVDTNPMMAAIARRTLASIVDADSVDGVADEGPRITPKLSTS